MERALARASGEVSAKESGRALEMVYDGGNDAFGGDGGDGESDACGGGDVCGGTDGGGACGDGGGLARGGGAGVDICQPKLHQSFLCLPLHSGEGPAAPD